MMVLYFMQYVAKTTIGYSFLLALQKDISIKVQDFTMLGSIFYVSYLIFQFPQNVLMQKFPVGKVLALNILLTSILVGAQAACTTLHSLMACRFFLGVCESSITAGFMLITSIYYTREEQSSRTGYWFMMNSVAHIFNSLMTYVLSEIQPNKLHAWQWLNLCVAFMAFTLFLLYWFLFPNSISKAWFLSERMKVKVIERMEPGGPCTDDRNKRFDTGQAIEAMHDVKTWIWFTYMILVNIPNITNHQSLLFAFFGFSDLETTALSCSFGAIHIVNVCIAMYFVKKFEDSRAYIGKTLMTCISNIKIPLYQVFGQIPNVFGVVLAIMAPENNKIVLITSIFLTWFSPIAYITALGLIISNTAGYTKRLVVQSIAMVGHCIGHIIAPRLWNEQYSPKNPSPWFVIGLCHLGCITLLIVVRVYLASENIRREENGWIPESDIESYLVSVRSRTEGVRLTPRKSLGFDSKLSVMNECNQEVCGEDLTDLEDLKEERKKAWVLVSIDGITN
ncbi:hypothetical protein CROQUDRAFT_670923 [Cronartium quercuum f. sp. fusiforme G11]|uniref:MFS general substrate transporter n=1 Tax=Cronartium quercuum f. sp. fusiforme G11 TaxID=708437 RepID=A0A9P6NJ04_9BASI|nr:hypothetical protein CROQUDRAFT_670923 [Cronartium quercuum f. sp. fusiforme G11]